MHTQLTIHNNVANNMKKVLKLNFSLIVLASIFLLNCKSEKKAENYISEINLPENISDFTSRMTENSNNEFEQHFLTNFRRTKIDPNGDNWIYRIINQNDTLKFYTVGLGDKGGCVRKYYEFMDNYYPNEKEFKPIEVIENEEIE